MHDMRHSRHAQALSLLPLPRESYHVTVWNGVNDANIRKLEPLHARDVADFIRRLPDSLHAPPTYLDFLAESHLARGGFAPLSFELQELEVWKNHVLVARLRPSDETSRGVLKEIENARAELSELAEQELGLAPARTYRPHVSLGYFWEESGAARAAQQIPEWSQNLARHTAGATLSFESLSLYGFTDMVSFSKPAPLPG